MDVEDATAEINAFLDRVDVDDLKHQDIWRKLTVLVKVKPDADIFPVRARYSKEPIPNIGLNYLSADQGLWFTLADCIASKLLTGKSPKVLEAIRFTSQDIQEGLTPIDIAGNPAFTSSPVNLIEPTTSINASSIGDGRSRRTSRRRRQRKTRPASDRSRASSSR